jgi:hypothetical protein
VPGRLGALHQQVDGWNAAQLGQWREGIQIRQDERGDAILALRAQAQRMAAGRQHSQPRATTEQAGDIGCGG